jgi:hypothetical protein
MTDHRSRDFINVAERFTDGLVNEQEFNQAYLQAVEAYNDQIDHAVFVQGGDQNSPIPFSEEAAGVACFVGENEAAYDTARDTAVACVRAVGDPNAVEERSAQAALLRCVFNFHRGAPAACGAGWLTPTVTNLVQAIYDERAFGRMPILADALEQAGCTNAELLSHCRGQGPHVRGCWVVDLLLGKE